MEKAHHDLKASIQIMDVNIQMYDKGVPQVYRVIAVELRKLLCDGKNSLLTRIYGDFKLHPISGYWEKIEKNKQWLEKFKKPYPEITFQTVGAIEQAPGKRPRIVKIFDVDSKKIPLNDWLDQILWTPHITLKGLIRSVADKESAHSDKTYNETLDFTRGGSFGGQPHHVDVIIKIGEYLLKALKKGYIEKTVKN